MLLAVLLPFSSPHILKNSFGFSTGGMKRFLYVHESMAQATEQDCIKKILDYCCLTMYRGQLTIIFKKSPEPEHGKTTVPSM